MTWRIGRGAPVLTWGVCAVLLAAGLSVQGEETPRDDEHGYAFHEFAGDLFIPWSDTAPYPPTYYGRDYAYQPAGALPKAVRAQVAAVVPGMTRERLEWLGWTENGGPAVAEFLLSFRRKAVDAAGGRPRYAAMRVALRPAAMPAEIYADAAQRRAWLHEHQPGPGPQDVVMSVSKPYLAAVIMD